MVLSSAIADQPYGPVVMSTAGRRLRVRRALRNLGMGRSIKIPDGRAYIACHACTLQLKPLASHLFRTMRVLSFFLGFVALGAESIIASPLHGGSNLCVVRTSYGASQGTQSPFRGGNTATVYKGIPFAAPPTGLNRWKAPSKPQS